MAKSENKTKPTAVSVDDFIAAVPHAQKRADAVVLAQMMQRLSGWEPVMWGPTIVGFGSYHYKYDSGREGDSLILGFSPRGGSHSLYMQVAYKDHPELMARLGKHKVSGSCLHINKLADVNPAVLEELLQHGLANARKRFPESFA